MFTWYAKRGNIPEENLHAVKLKPVGEKYGSLHKM